MKTTENAYAKINLFLEVTGKREDGYHELDSIMQTVSLSDKVDVEATDGDGIELMCDDGTLPTDEGNLAYRAAKLYNDTYGITAKTTISIKKHIPISAGLAGGSADAAAVLRALDRLHGKASGIDELCLLGKKLGADVPFCIRCGIARTKGIGDIIEHCPPLPPCYIVVAIGSGRKSTASAYGEIDRLPTREIRNADGIVSAIRSGDLTAIGAEAYNIFERVTDYAVEIKTVMRACGSLGELMSGSGTSVFGLFDNEAKANDATAALTKKGFTAETCLAKTVD